MNAVLIAFIVLALCPQFAKASDGATLDMAIGRPVISIQNPDGSKAYYDGISTNVSVGEPVLGGKSFAFKLVGSFRYFDKKKYKFNFGERNSPVDRPNGRHRSPMGIFVGRV